MDVSLLKNAVIINIQLDLLSTRPPIIHPSLCSPYTVCLPLSLPLSLYSRRVSALSLPAVTLPQVVSSLHLSPLSLSLLLLFCGQTGSGGGVLSWGLLFQPRQLCSCQPTAIHPFFANVHFPPTHILHPLLVVFFRCLLNLHTVFPETVVSSPVVGACHSLAGTGTSEAKRLLTLVWANARQNASHWICVFPFVSLCLAMRMWPALKHRPQCELKDKTQRCAGIGRCSANKIAVTYFKKSRETKFKVNVTSFTHKGQFIEGQNSACENRQGRSTDCF